MKVSDYLPFLIVNLLCFGIGGLIVRYSGFYREHIPIVVTGRANTIDGVRGFLALGVFFAHVAAMRAYYANGTWGDPDATFHSLCGEVGVSLFFMITGFLFWGKVVRSSGAFNAEALYLSRLRRIVPMYLVSVFMSLAVVAVLSGFSLQVSPANLVRELRSWFSFGFMYAGDVNGVKDAHYINAVYWTLAFEWQFYLLLPILALLARGRGVWVVLPVAVLYCLQTPVTLNFICGAVAAVLVEKKWLNGQLASWQMTPLAILALAIVFLFPSAFAALPVLVMFIFFIFVADGNSLFGVLASRPARLLGSISYSIYLTHCVILYALVWLVNLYWPVATLARINYWAVATAAALLAVLVSALTYRYVEHPFLSRRAVNSTLPDGVDRKLGLQ